MGTLVLKKKCSKCKKEKDVSLFYKAKRLKDGLTTQCKKCMSDYRKANRIKNRDYMRKRRKEDNDYIKKTRRKSYQRQDIALRIFRQARNRAKRKNTEFSISPEDIIIPKLCPYLKVPFILGVKGNYEYTPSLDRIDNNKGYVKGNIEVISKKANSMKNSASKKELLNFANSIIKNLNKIWI